VAGVGEEGEGEGDDEGGDRVSLKTVFCTVQHRSAPANLTAKAELRCTGCGQIHQAARQFFAADLEPVRVGKKKFKKGGKAKGKKKGGGQADAKAGKGGKA
jgi:hypothetical protein